MTQLLAAEQAQDEKNSPVEVKPSELPTFKEYQAKISEEKEQLKLVPDVPKSGEHTKASTQSNLQPGTSVSEESQSIANQKDASVEHSPAQPRNDSPSAKSIEPNAKQSMQPPLSAQVLVRRNVADPHCGAKMLGANPAAKYADHILNSNPDEYMNQPCNSDMWFVIETCEPVHLRTIHIANFELFSSRFKTFKVYVSDRYPAKNWHLAGTFQARDQRSLQVFDLQDDHICKYVKFEILDFHGIEHFCPVTMVRLFGSSSDDDDDDEVIVPPVSPVKVNGSDNLIDEESSGSTDPAASSEPSDKAQPTQPPPIDAPPDRQSTPATAAASSNENAKENRFKDPPTAKERPAPPNQIHLQPLRKSMGTSVLSRATNFVVGLISGLWSAHEERSAVRMSKADIEGLALNADEISVMNHLLFMHALRPHAKNRPLDQDRAEYLLDCIMSLDRLLQSMGHAPSPVTVPLAAAGPCQASLEWLEQASRHQFSSRNRFMWRLLAAYRNLTCPMASEPGPRLLNARDGHLWASRSWGDLFESLMHDQTLESVAPMLMTTLPPLDTTTAAPRLDKNIPIEPKATVSQANLADELVLPAKVGGSRNGAKDASALMRLTNRVKAIEANVSVSMNYLEQLSENYRRQTERLSRVQSTMASDVLRLERRDEFLDLQLVRLERRVAQLEEMEGFDVKPFLQSPVYSKTGLAIYRNLSLLYELDHMQHGQRRGFIHDGNVDWLTHYWAWLTHQCSHLWRLIPWAQRFPAHGRTRASTSQIKKEKPSFIHRDSIFEIAYLVILHLVLALVSHLIIYYVYIKHKIADAMKTNPPAPISSDQIQLKSLRPTDVPEIVPVKGT